MTSAMVSRLICAGMIAASLTGDVIARAGSARPHGASDTAPAEGAGADKTADRGAVAALSPRIILWAWERPENLAYVDPAVVGVACFHGRIRLTADEAVYTPRTQRLSVPDGVFRLPVVRIETDRLSPPSLSDQQLDETGRLLLRSCALTGAGEIQIDFDAAVKEREFYRKLLTRLRQTLPVGTRISITALASWCLADCWIRDLPVDEVVPMMFDMAADEKAVLIWFRSGRSFAPGLPGRCLGLSVRQSSIRTVLEQNPAGVLDSSRRIYYFSPRPWDRSTVKQLLEDVSEWTQPKPLAQEEDLGTR